MSQQKDAEKKTHMELTDLESGVLYNLRVRGYSRGGDGLSSSPTIQFMLGPNCKALQGTSYI